MIGANPLSPPFQALLDGLGAVLVFLYEYIPNYGVGIILLTLAIRVLLLPLGIKQIRSMQAMQALQPKMKELQRKYKGNRQKVQEETMKLYKEHGVNPLSGCLPLLAQFPVLIALFGVLSVPAGLPHVRGTGSPFAAEENFSRLYKDVLRPGQARGIDFLGANLVCSAREAGDPEVPIPRTGTVPAISKDCGSGWPVRIPFYLFLAAMIATTYYQQRQMQRASPTQSQQQQMLTRIMPVFFGFIGFGFPAGLVVYWTTTNLVQIGQQHFMLPRPGASEPSRGKGTGARSGDGRRGGLVRKLLNADEPEDRPSDGKPGTTPSKRSPSSTPHSKGDGAGGGKQRSSGPRGQSGRRSGGAGGRDGGNRKKRRKR